MFISKPFKLHSIEEAVVNAVGKSKTKEIS
jgi:hypothetical protein